MSEPSAAYRRGYAQAITDAADIALNRRDACKSAAQQYRDKEMPEMAATEQCAASEAGHILDGILKLRPPGEDKRGLPFSGWGF